jgi:HPt (histidine-containing phosphotransfer) domain-containing protein
VQLRIDRGVEGDGAGRAAVIDWHKAREFAGGDAALLAEIIEAARSETPRVLADLRRGLAEGDLTLAGRSAHTLKSSANYLGAQELAAIALRVELLAREGRLTMDCEELMALQREASEFMAALADAPSSAAAHFAAVSPTTQ